MCTDCDAQTDAVPLSPCGDYNPACRDWNLGTDPFPMPEDDPEHVDADGVGLNDDGDLVLDQTSVDFNFMYIANTNDLGRGTVSKIDTELAVETARYYSVTCFGNSAWEQGDCLDVAGRPLSMAAMSPSRTAVDFNFDVWVANRTFHENVPPTATKIANSMDDCIDRNGDGVIDTSQDWDGDGVINTDCDGDGVPDDITTQCTNGLPPEFLGYDDECVLFTTMYAENGEVGRSICLDGGDPYSGGAGNAWVGTNGRAGNNRFFKINGTTGQVVASVDLPPAHNPYGCAVDSRGILWAASQASSGGSPALSDPSGRLVYLDVYQPSSVGTVILPPWNDTQFYGIGVDSDDSVWMGGWGSGDVFRYRPDRTSFLALASGTWTRVLTSALGVGQTAGVAADLRGYVWVAQNDGGYILRIPQSIADGEHAGTVAERYGTGFGGAMRGVGVDFGGNVWGISHDASLATRMEVDSLGDPLGTVTQRSTGTNPYTYSDFTGYGLRNFTRPRGTYSLLLQPCDGLGEQTTWVRVEWNATTPPDTAVRLRVRTGDGPSPSQMGSWFGQWDSSPAMLQELPLGPIAPNPAPYLQLELELTSEDRETTPVVHDLQVVFICASSVD